MPKPIIEDKPKPPSFREFPALKEAKLGKLTLEYVKHRDEEKKGKEAEARKKAVGKLITEALKQSGQKSVDVDDITVTLTRGVSQSKIDPEKLARTLVLEFELDPEKVAEVIADCTDEGGEYFFPKITTPKEAE